MAIDPQELELRKTFYGERLTLNDRHQTEVRSLQADQQARFVAFKKSKTDAAVAAAPAPVTKSA